MLEVFDKTMGLLFISAMFETKQNIKQDSSDERVMAWIVVMS